MVKIKNIVNHYISGEKLYNKIVMPVCERYKLTYMEFTVLMFLSNNPGYNSASEIVSYRHLTKSHVSISVKSLFEKKLIRKDEENSNHKTVRLLLEKSALPIVEEGRKAQRKYSGLIFEGFTREERENLFGLIRRIDENIKINLDK